MELAATVQPCKTKVSLRLSMLSVVDSSKTLKTMLKNKMEEVCVAGVKSTPESGSSASENQLGLWAQENLRGQGYYH
jgi:hypothetical protein